MRILFRHTIRFLAFSLVLAGPFRSAAGPFQNLMDTARNFNRVRYVIMLDSSGSMEGKFPQVRQALAASLGNLKTGDVITFAHFNSYVLPVYRAFKVRSQADIQLLQTAVTRIQSVGAWTDLKEALFSSSAYMEELEKQFPGYMGLLLVFSDNIDDPPPWTYRAARNDISSIYDRLKDYQKWAIFGKALQTATNATATNATPGKEKTVGIKPPGDPKKAAAVQRMREQITTIQQKGPGKVTLDDLVALKNSANTILNLGVDQGSQAELAGILYSVERLLQITKKNAQTKRSGEFKDILKDMREKKFIKILVGEDSGNKQGIGKAIGGSSVPLPKTGNVTSFVTNVLKAVQLARWLTVILYALVSIVLFFTVGRRSKPLAVVLIVVLGLATAFFFEDVTGLIAHLATGILGLGNKVF